MPDRFARAVGIDIGTSGVRVAAVDGTGTMLADYSVRFPDGAREEPAAWRRAVEAVLTGLAAALPLSEVTAVTVDGTSGTLLALDGAGNPIGPASMYHSVCDDAAVLAAVHEAAPLESSARGASSPLCRAILLARRQGAQRVVHQADWVAGLLCGRFDTTDCNNALKTGGDAEALIWPSWLGSAGMDTTFLPAIVEPGRPIAFVRPEAMALGLPRSALVHAGTTDGCASFLATGADQPGDAVTALGSTLVLKMLSNVPINAARYGIYSHRIGDRYLVGGASNSGGEVLNALFSAERLAKLSARVRADHPTGLDYYPLLRPGERFPISDPAWPPRLHPRPDDENLFFQGVLEGIAEIEHQGYARLASLGAPTLRSVRSVGGGAANAGWTALRQRRLNAPFLRSESEAACVGAAMLGLTASQAAGKEAEALR
jgi:D-ribulokinase